MAGAAQQRWSLGLGLLGPGGLLFAEKGDSGALCACGGAGYRKEYCTFLNLALGPEVAANNNEQFEIVGSCR